MSIPGWRFYWHQHRRRMGWLKPAAHLRWCWRPESGWRRRVWPLLPMPLKRRIAVHKSRQ